MSRGRETHVQKVKMMRTKARDLLVTVIPLINIKVEFVHQLTSRKYIYVLEQQTFLRGDDTKSNSGLECSISSGKKADGNVNMKTFPDARRMYREWEALATRPTTGISVAGVVSLVHRTWSTTHGNSLPVKPASIQRKKYKLFYYGVRQRD